MKKVRMLSIVIFVAAVITYGLHNLNEWKNRDFGSPVIKVDGNSVTVSCTAGEEAMLEGVTAEDKKDGDVSDTLMIETMSNFIEKGRRNITIAAFDSDNHVTKVTREVVYNDYHSPRFTLSEPLRFPKNTTTILSGMGVEDVLDGTLTSNIKTSGDYYVEVDTPGEYSMVFTVTNSAGDVSELPATVEIYDPAEEALKPQIMLSEYIVYTSVGTSINPWDYVEQITIGTSEYIRGGDNALTNAEYYHIYESEVTISNEVDYSVPGVYEITYRYKTQDREPGSVRLIVVVSE